MSRLNEAKDNNVGAGPAWTPFGAVLKALSVPAYASGKAIQNPASALNYSILDAWKDKDPVTPGTALERRGALDAVPDRYGIRTLTKLGADIALDPSTYVTFGGGAAARSGVRAAQLAASKEIDDIIRAGATPTMAQRAGATAEVAKAKLEAPSSFKVSLRVPLSRNKEIPLGESEGIAKAAQRAKATISKRFGGDALARGFSSDRGIGQAVSDVFHDVRRVGESELRRLGTAAADLDKQIAKAEKRLGMKRGEGATAITRHLDNPDRYDLPAGLEDLSAHSRDLLDDLNRMEKDAGIDYTEVEHYVSHLGATPADSRRIAEIYAKPTANRLDEPFFVKPRESKNLDEFEAIGREQGFTPEFNIARIIERRARASVNARTKKAIDDAVFDTFGTKTPDTSVGDAFDEWLKTSPDEFLQAAGVATARKYHATEQLPDDIARDLERVHAQITPLVKDDDALERTRIFLKKLTSRWKGLALLSPGYHIRNLYDDGIRAYWAGARNPMSFAQAARVQLGRDGSLRIGKEVWRNDEIARRAEVYGVLDTGWVRSETESSDEFLRRKGLQGPGKGPLARGSQAVGNFRENNLRLGTWLELLKAGKSPDEAARIVREYLFEYGKTSLFIDRARSFWFPFITFPSKAIPFTLREFARRPGRGANFAKVIQASNEAGGDPDLSLLPAGSQSSFAAPVPKLLSRLIGAPTDQPMLVNPERLFAAGSLNLLDPRVARARQNVLGGLLNPFMRVPLEMAANKSFYLGTDLPSLARSTPAIDQIARVVPIPSYVPAGQPYGYTKAGAPKIKRDFYTGQPVGGYSSYLDSILRLLPAYGQAASITPGGSSSAQLGAARFFFGVPVAPFDRAKALYRVQRFGNP